MPTTLIVDEDLGFTFWLGQTLDAIGWTAVPAQNISAADELVRVHRLQPDVVVIDPFVRDAFLFIDCLRKLQPFLKVVAAIPDVWGRSWPTIPEFDAAVGKPRHFTPAASLEWVGLIRNMLSSTWGEPHGGVDTSGN